MDNIVVYEDEIDVCLQEYVESRNIEDERKMTASMWAAALQYIHERVFKNDKYALRQASTKNNCPYDLDKVEKLLDKYIFMCNDHNQRICIEHFCKLTGLTKATISYWTNDLRRSGDRKAKQIVGKLMENSLVAADDLALSRTGVNSIAYANRVHDNYDAFMSKQDNNNKVIDVDDLAARLGITKQLALPDGKQEPEPLEKVKHPYDDLDIDMMDF